MFESEVYKNNITKLSNDMIMAILGATDTARNNTIISICHLAKNKQNHQKVKDEIRAF